LTCAQSKRILDTSFFFPHLISSKSFKTAFYFIKISIMTSQRRRQLKFTAVVVAVAAIDERRR
jgi:hypothetical protein